MDRLATEGIILTQNYVQEMCTPTRAALMTGRYPFRYGMTAYTIGADEPWGIPMHQPFFPQLLQAAGYDTAVFGKWHLGFFKPECEHRTYRGLLTATEGGEQCTALRPIWLL